MKAALSFLSSDEELLKVSMEVAFKNLLTGQVLPPANAGKQDPDLDKCTQLVELAINGKH